MSQLRSEIPFMASLWIRSGCDMKVDPSVETYQVGAHFKALIKAILVAPSRILENFFSFCVTPPAALCFWCQFFVAPLSSQNILGTDFWQHLEGAGTKRLCARHREGRTVPGNRGDPLQLREGLSAQGNLQGASSPRPAGAPRR